MYDSSVRNNEHVYNWVIEALAEAARGMRDGRNIPCASSTVNKEMLLLNPKLVRRGFFPILVTVSGPLWCLF